jgi:hypothetical protein
MRRRRDRGHRGLPGSPNPTEWIHSVSASVPGHHEQIHGLGGEHQRNHTFQRRGCVVVCRPVHSRTIGLVEGARRREFEKCARHTWYRTSRVVHHGGQWQLACCDCAEGREGGGVRRSGPTFTVAGFRRHCGRRGHGGSDQAGAVMDVSDSQFTIVVAPLRHSARSLVGDDPDDL